MTNVQYIAISGIFFSKNPCSELILCATIELSCHNTTLALSIAIPSASQTIPLMLLCENKKVVWMDNAINNMNRKLCMILFVSFLFNLEFCCHIPLLIYTVKFHFLVNPILTGSIVIEQWIEFGFEMVITVRFQYNANVVHQTVVM